MTIRQSDNQQLFRCLELLMRSPMNLKDPKLDQRTQPIQPAQLKQPMGQPPAMAPAFPATPASYMEPSDQANLPLPFFRPACGAEDPPPLRGPKLMGPGSWRVFHGEQSPNSNQISVNPWGFINFLGEVSLTVVLIIFGKPGRFNRLAVSTD